MTVNTTAIINSLEGYVLDIKPYHSEADIIENAGIAWLNESLPKHKIRFSPQAENQIDFLTNEGLPELKTFIIRQLEYDPTNTNKKRVENFGGYWTLSYRTWRADFILIETQASIIGIRSGYTEEEIINNSDPYSDKELHKKFKNFMK